MQLLRNPSILWHSSVGTEVGGYESTGLEFPKTYRVTAMRDAKIGFLSGPKLSLHCRFVVSVSPVRFRHQGSTIVFNQSAQSATRPTEVFPSDILVAPMLMH